MCLCAAVFGCEEEPLLLVEKGAISVMPEELGLLTVVGRPVRGTIDIRSLGPGELGLSSIAFAEPVKELSLEAPVLPAALEKDALYSFDVLFTPELVGTFTTHLLVASNDERRPVLEIRVVARAEAAPCPSCCVPMAMRNCRPPGIPLLGECRIGKETCGDDAIWGACEGFVRPSNEICDNGLDENCDGVADENCEPPPPPPPPPPVAEELIDVPEPEPIACASASPGSRFVCSELTTATIPPIQSNCRQTFPTAKRPPCEVPRPGKQYYLDPLHGNDGNSGTSPSEAWVSMCHALDSVPSNATLNVAEGEYLIEEVYLDRGVAVVGGWDSTFTTWNPDLYHSVFTGQLTLDHGAAVWAGFYMQAADESWPYVDYSIELHRVIAGSLLRNYIEMIWLPRSGAEVFTGLHTAPCEGTGNVIACNDIYMHSLGAARMAGLNYGGIRPASGSSRVLANHICADNLATWSPTLIDVALGCPQGQSTFALTFANNVLEASTNTRDSVGMNLSSCEGVDPYSVAITNNTLVGTFRGLLGGAWGTDGPLRLRVTNNIIAGSSAPLRPPLLAREAIAMLGTQMIFESAENNLLFQHYPNDIAQAPLIDAGNDTTNTSSMASVFAGPSDFSLNPAGAGIRTGRNVFALPEYGDLRTDIDGKTRSSTGAWDRGAYQTSR